MEESENFTYWSSIGNDFNGEEIIYDFLEEVKDENQPELDDLFV